MKALKTAFNPYIIVFEVRKMTSAKLPKKLIIMNILDILNKYTDEEHTLTQKEIQQKLKTEYNMDVDRKAVKRNLMNLEEFGYAIGYDEGDPRYTLNNKTGEYEENRILTNFWIEHDFDNSELHMLIDSVVFSKHIPQKHKKDLIAKLEGLTSVYFQKSSKNLLFSNEIVAQNKNWFLNIELLNEAINQHCKVHFIYNDYGIDKKLHPRNEVTMIPHRIVSTNNHYYLICKTEQSDDYYHYRVDKITDLQVLEDEHFAPIKGFDVQSYLSSHVYMFPGEPEYIYMNVDADIIGDIVDYFGGNFLILESDEGIIKIRVKSNKNDIYYWALQYGNHVEITEPQELRDKIRTTVESMSRTYLETNEDKYSRALERAKKRNYLWFYKMDLTNKDLNELPTDVADLTLAYTKVNSYDFLEKFANVEKLSMRFNRPPSFGFLKKFEQLRVLSLVRTGFNDLSVVKHLERIEFLEIQERKDVDNLELIYKMPKLKRLILSRNLIRQIDVEKLKELNPDVIVHNYKR